MKGPSGGSGGVSRMKRGGSQAAFKGGHTSMSRHRPGSRPRCPMKDTPPEGDRAKDLPRDLSRRRSRPFWAGGASNARPAARAGPTYGRRQGYSQIASQAGIAPRAHAGGCFSPAPAWQPRRPRLECASKLRVLPKVGHLRVARSSARRDLHIAPSGPLCAAGRASARRDLCARAGAAVILAHAAGRLPHRQAVLAGRRPPPEAART